MSAPARGLYESLITEGIEAQLRELGERLVAVRSDLRAAEAADRIALHLARVIQRAIGGLDDERRLVDGVELARRIVTILTPGPDADALSDVPVAPGSVLRAIAGRLPDGTIESLPEPMIPLLDTTLLTNSPGEPRVGHQLLTEIRSADRIDVVMAFIRRSGLGPLRDALRAHCDARRPLRVLTTTYTESTEAEALDALRALRAEVRVSYDTSTTRLHAKAWLFHRDSGLSTAYIGSSNLTHAAQVSGLEWNVRVSGARNPDVVAKVAAVFESYWNSGEFLDYDRDTFLARARQAAPAGPRVLLSPIELRLEPFQERMLEQVAVARHLGHRWNLLVSATGTGKTVMAAVDYARLRQTLPRARLLFVAHREEILDQALATFRHATRDATFGERWLAGQRPRRFEHVFASIQSLHATGLAHLPPDHFDVVIVDEFHHAAAVSYRELLDHVRPNQLLGLTATPERSDGLPILDWFGGRPAAELRLWDAIDQHRLSPFLYFGIHDGLDLRDIPWRRGRGYDVQRLSRLFTTNDVWARSVVDRVSERVGDPRAMRALGFCVSVDHARFMARVFGESGIPAAAIWSDSPDDERRTALVDLSARRVNVVFSVDLFNEGIDLPDVDTLLLLRPTDSPTLFLQQLGRGLRRSPGKSACTVLDFVGRHRAEFRFERRLRALLGGSRRDVIEQIQSGFPFLPAGCHMELDPIASDVVLTNIREALPSALRAKIKELRDLVSDGRPPSLAEYLDETGRELDDVYGGGRSWSDLCAEAGLPVGSPGPSERVLRRACSRLLHVDDQMRIGAYSELLSHPSAPDPGLLAERDRRFLRMLVSSVCDRAISKSASLVEGCALLWHHPQVRTELQELLGVLATRVNHIPRRLLAHGSVPLQVHARYSRLEILAGFGVGEGAKVAPWQTGVYAIPEARTDLLAFTLDKTSGQFSPTTRYRDYAISRELIHWESQSMTREESETGQRYRHHVARGTSIMLFARLRADDRAFWFLGPATYVRHQSECPMAVTWRLEYPLPADLHASFAAAVA